MKILTVICACLIADTCYAQSDCKVLDPNLSGTYTGECKNGEAHGKGEAKGLHKYSGNFKAGVPDGKGTYYYTESEYYSGAFQDGVKEGKGEMHYIRNGNDSIVKGFWSGDEFRGKEYITYSVSGEKRFDQFEARPTKETGKTITFEISTTSGTPNGTPTTLTDGVQYLLLLNTLESTNGIEVRKTSEFNTALKTTVKYEVDKFPVKLTAHLSIGEPLYLELYKAANWTIRIYVNK